MKISTYKKKFATMTNKQFIEYVKRRWCNSRKQPLLDMLDELMDADDKPRCDHSKTMDELIVENREAIADYIIEAYEEAME